MKAKYGEHVRMVYTDADSFVFLTKTDDIYEDLKGIKDEMDSSGFDKYHKCYHASNKEFLVNLRMRQMENMTGFVGKRPKTYA